MKIAKAELIIGYVTNVRLLPSVYAKNCPTPATMPRFSIGKYGGTPIALTSCQVEGG
jgi:hypothetical protein